MTKGKPWAPEKEKQLRDLVAAEFPLHIIAAKLEKNPEAVRKKIERLGLEVVDLKGYRTTTLELPKELPSIEEALKILAGALKSAAKSGLDKVEIQRLQVAATLAKTYKELLADYINYRMIEQKIIELEAKYAKLLQEKAESVTSK